MAAAERVVGRPGERGPLARALRPVALVYEFASLVRSTAYETGYLRTVRVGRPVISVGNLTMGGTGKTPIVAMLAAFLTEQNVRVAILTRGYGRRSKGRQVVHAGDANLEKATADVVGDEPALLARELDDVAIVVDADRVSAAEWAIAAADADVLLLDDGFQHLRLARDLNLLVLDATDPFGGGYLPPSGRLREPLQAIKRADAVIVTRSDRPFDGDAITRVVTAARSAETPIYFAYHDITGLRALGPLESSRTVASLRGKRVGVITAIGNPAVFVEDLENVGMDVVSTSLFPDHHAFGQHDLDRAAVAAATAGAEILLTTEKDAVKLERLQIKPNQLFAVRIAFRSEHEALIKSMCMKAILAYGRASTRGSGETS